MTNNAPQFISALLFMLFSISVQAKADDITSVTVAFTFSMPPYLTADNTGGIERDIIYEAFRAADYKNIEILNVHYLRAIKLSKLENIDAIVSNQSNTIYSNNIPDIIASHKTIDYVDCAITLGERNIKLDNIQDYYDKSIWAFKSASEVLGNNFKKMTQGNPLYTEDFDQLKQLDMLAMKRIDIAISDRNIFSAKLQSSKEFRGLPFNFHNIGPVTPRVIRSTNKALINRFNKGLDLIKRNGRYNDIINSYQSRYASSCEK